MDMQRLDRVLGGVQICSFDEAFTMEYVNDGFCQLTGYEPEELLGKCHEMLVYPEDYGKMCRAVMDCGTGNCSFSLEYRILHKDGTVIWVLDNGTVYQEETVARIQRILTDISCYKQQEEELRIFEKRCHIVMKQLDISVFEYDLTTQRLTFFKQDANRSALPDVLENGPELLIQSGAIRPDYVDGYREMYQKIQEGEPFANCYINARDADNTIYEYELSLTTIYGIDGKPIRAVGIKKDISQMRRLQREQKFSQAMVRDKKFVFEANVTTNTVVYADEEWLPDGLGIHLPFDRLIAAVAEQEVDPEYQGHVKKYLSAEYINHCYKSGERLSVFTYKRFAGNRQYQWFESTVNIVQDDLTGNISIRMYSININGRKNKEQNAEKERLLYESMVANAIQAYEINLTQDIFVKGFESWESLYGIKASNCFSEMLDQFCRSAIYKEDQPGFWSSMARSSLVQAFHENRQQLTCQYRKKDIQGEQRWVVCTTHLYEDPDSGDIRAYSYVEDIDKEKREELALKYRAEHDIMTGLYNKETSMEQMKETLQNSSGLYDKHAMLIIDIDHFKEINDNFGHMYGDQIISKVGGAIRSVFRGSDIVGRFGGDEFCALITNLHGEDNALQKAEQLCERIRGTCNVEGVVCDISASIGIAIYPNDGTSFEVLFHKADNALYKAKDRGRDRFVW